jgi:1-acyl-sn-glycerol-3-phosphate acyltransferase
MLRALLRALFRRVLAIYFRDIELVGELPSKNTRGRLFGANHVNGLVDPILVLATAPCEASPVAKSTLWAIPGLRWLLDAIDAVPVVRRKDNPDKSPQENDEVFARVGAHLGGGGNILIFPEGTSHNEPHLLPLRTGPGRMLARAKADGAAGLTFQAVALEFDARTIFRSRALLVFGPVRDVDALGGGEEIVKAVTDRLAGDLSELLVEGVTWQDRLLIARVAEMFANGERDRSLAGWNAVGRQVEAARRTLGADPLYESIRERVAAYYAGLEGAGLTDYRVAGGGNFEVRRAVRAVGMLAALPLALLGVALYFVPYQLPRLAVRLSRGTEDVVSTYKLGAGLLVHPLWAAALVALAWLKLPHAVATAATAAILLSPFAALAWMDHAPRLRAKVRMLVSQEAVERLREERRQVMAMLDEARQRLPPAPGADMAPAGSATR